MARKKTNINGIMVEFDENETPAQIINKIAPNRQGPVVLSTDTGGYEVRNIADLRTLPEGEKGVVLTMQETLVQGSDVNTRKKFLSMEIENITSFLNEFSYSKKTIKPSISFGKEWEYIRIDNFPLSDAYSPDYEDIGIVILDYPDLAPVGIHIYNNSPNLQHIKYMIKGGLFDDYSALPLAYQDHVFEMPGWTWICFRYQNFNWNFNPNNIMLGDNLYKYIVALYAALSSEFHA